MLLLLDNHDSFTYNLVQYLKQLQQQVVVYRNNEITLNEIDRLKPDHIVISPGPGKPEHAGITCELIKKYAGSIPILGVCLGHQAIAQVFGADIIQAEHIMHGKTSQIEHVGEGLFEGVENPFTATRYHSLIIDPDTVPAEFQVTAWVQNQPGNIMAIAHQELSLYGVQFHPESILTKQGVRILENFFRV